MRTRFSSAVAAIITLAFAATASAQFGAVQPIPPPEDFHVELGLMWWTPTPELTIDTEQVNNLTGTSAVDFVQEFNLQKARFTEFRSVLKGSRKHEVRVSHVPAEYTASTTLQRTITYKGVTFPVSAPATAHLKWDLWRIGYQYNFVTSQHALAGFITEVKYNRVTGDITSPIGSASADQTAPVPTIGLLVRGYVQKYVSITGEFSGFKVPHIKSFDGKFWDLDLYATGSITKYVGLQGGYRSVQAHYVVDTEAGDLRLKGPYFGAMVRF